MESTQFKQNDYPIEGLSFLRSVMKAVAMHYGTFNLSDEPLDEPPSRFRKAAEAKALDEQAAWLLRIGETRLF